MHVAFYDKMKTALLLAAVVFALGWADTAQAQWSTKWLAVGDFQHPYLSGGAEPEELAADVIWYYPGIHPRTGSSRWKALWVSVLNFKDETGKTWDVRTSHIGPRVLGLGEMFDVEHKLIAKFDAPKVTVDGLDTFLRPAFVDEVDPTMNADRAVKNVVNMSVGITMERYAQQFSVDPHDDYHLVEYTFTNTGNVDDDPEIELPDQTLEGVYFVMNDHATANAPAGAWDNSAGGIVWGQYTMNDQVGDGHEDYGVDLRAHFSWVGFIPSKANSHNTIGTPMWYEHQWYSVKGDTLGRLAGAHMVGSVTVHADGEAHAPGVSLPDDPAQPRLMSYMEHDWSEMTTGNDHNNVAKMRFERDYIENGANYSAVGYNNTSQRVWPHHAYLVEPDGDFINTSGDPSLGRAGGWAYVSGYGPYTMAPGEQVKIVIADGARGLSEAARWDIGRAYKLSGGDDSLRIPFDANGDGVIDPVKENLKKNEWVMTARDSLFQLFDHAIENYNSGYNIPRPPLPPSEFHVTSGTDQIELAWDAFPGESPAGGWEVWRAQKDYHGIITALRVGGDGLAVPDMARQYTKIASLPASERSYTDTDVQRGLSYFYYLQAVGPVNNDPTGGVQTGVPLKSSRYYTQTYEPAFLRRAPGATLDDVRIVPNPYNISADPSVRFDVQDRLAFFGLPAKATIKIFTELGELVDTIEHSDGSGDEFWNLTTSSRQLIVSGLYIAVIKDEETGDQVVRKFIVIR